VDGEAGELTIAGFPLEELAPNATFEEVLFLLWSDRLPTAQELLALRQELALRRPLSEASLDILRLSVARKTPVMDTLRMAVDAIGTCEGEPHRPPDLPDVGCGIALTAPMPTIVAAYWRLIHGLQPIAPDRRSVTPPTSVHARGQTGACGQGARAGDLPEHRRRPRHERLDLHGAGDLPAPAPTCCRPLSAVSER